MSRLILSSPEVSPVFVQKVSNCNKNEEVISRQSESIAQPLFAPSFSRSAIFLLLAQYFGTAPTAINTTPLQEVSLSYLIMASETVAEAPQDASEKDAEVRPDSDLFVMMCMLLLVSSLTLASLAPSLACS